MLLSPLLLSLPISIVSISLQTDELGRMKSFCLIERGKIDLLSLPFELSRRLVSYSRRNISSVNERPSERPQRACASQSRLFLHCFH